MTQEIQDKVNVIAGAFQPVIDAANAIPALVDAQELIKYNEGVEAGKAMIQLPDPTDPAAQYTQEQMDAAVTAGKEQQRSEDQVQLDDLSGKLAALQVSYDASALECESLKAKYDDLVARVKAAKVDDDALIASL